MKQMKRLLAFIMVLFMAFSVLPGSTIQADAAKKKTVKVKKVTLNKKSATLIKGSKLALKVTFSPKNTTQKKLVWSTSNKKVATVTSKGVVKAVKAGKATITVKVKGTSKKATCKVTVKNPVKVKKITLNAKSVSLNEGSKKTLKATLSPKNTTEKTITWSTSNKKVATVTSKGVVKAVKKGTATITAKVKGTSKKASCKITVKFKTPVKADVKVDVKVTKLSFTDSQKTIKEYATYQTKLNIAPSNATNKAVTYTSSNTSVATVDTNGKVTAKKIGNAVITATAKDGSGKKATMNLTVEFTPTRYVMTCDKDAQVYSKMQGDTRHVNQAFELSRDTVNYFAYNRKTSIRYQQEVTGTQRKETITILEAFPGTVYYAVCGENGCFEETFAEAGVKVQVYKGDTLLKTYQGPQKQGQTWVVSSCQAEMSTFTSIDKVLDNIYALTDYWYGNLNVTELTGKDVERVIVRSSRTIEIYTSSEGFLSNPAEYLDSLSVVCKGKEIKSQWAFADGVNKLLLSNSTGRTREYLVDVFKTGYEELAITKITSDATGRWKFELSDSDSNELEVLGSEESVNLEHLNIECGNKKVDYRIVSMGNSDEGLPEIAVIHPNGVERKYRIWYTQDYTLAHPELEIQSLKSTDGSITGYDYETNGITLYGNKRWADEWKALPNVLEITFKGENVTWKLDDSYGPPYLILIDQSGNEYSYYIQYAIDYEALYGDLSVRDFTCSDDAFLGGYLSDEQMILYGTKDFEDYKDKIRVDILQKDAKWTFEKRISYGYSFWYLVLTGVDGTTREYPIYPEQDIMVTYGTFEVLDIRHKDILSVSVEESEISILGVLPSLASYGKELDIQFGEKGITYELNKTQDASRYEPEKWALTLNGEDATKREYTVSYEQDADAYYGDLKINNITSADGSVTYWKVDNGNTVVIGGTEAKFDTIQPQIVVSSLDASVKCYFETYTDEYESECWRLVLEDKEDMKRVYQVEYFMDLDAVYGNLQIGESTIQSKDNSLLRYLVYPSTIWMYGKHADFDTMKEQLIYDLDADVTVTYGYNAEFNCSTLILTNSSGKTRTFLIDYVTE